MIKNSITRNKELLLASTMIALLSGCASIVTKPEIGGVKKVALVSVSANKNIIYTSGGRIEDLDRGTRERIGKLAYKAFAEEIKRLKWEIIPVELVKENEFYKKEFKEPEVSQDASFLKKAGQLLDSAVADQFINPPGMYHAKWQKHNQSNSGGMSFSLANLSLTKEKDTKTLLTELAQSLNVDAVITVTNDICYTGATAVLGNGTAKLTVGSTIRAVSSDGNLVVKMDEPENRCDGDRGESNSTLTMVAGIIPLGIGTFIDPSIKTAINVADPASASKLNNYDKLITAIDEATKNSAKIAVDKIKKAIED